MTPEEAEHYNRLLYPERYKSKTPSRIFAACAVVAVCIGLCYGVVYCIKSYQKKVAQQEAEREASEQQRRYAEQDQLRRERAPIVVKGLYIGMPIAELPNVVATKFAGWDLYNGDKLAYATDFSITKVSLFGLDSIRVVCDASRQVVLIQFDAKVSEYVFNAQSMTARQFATSFMNSYNLDQLEPRGNLWELYRPHDKVLVRVDTEKRLLLQRLTNPEVLQPNFK